MRVVATVVCVGLLLVTGLNGNHSAGPAPQTAEAVLARAAESLGGAARLRAIDRLRIEVQQRQSMSPAPPRPRSYNLWLPDRFQNVVPGLVTHTLVGGKLTFSRDVSDEIRQNAEESIPAMFRVVSLQFLLRGPGLAAPRLVGDATIEGMTGTVVAFPRADGSGVPLRILFARDSGQPLAMVGSTRPFGSTDPPTDRVYRLDDYRAVDGVRFPHRITIVDPKNELITEVQRIVVNPPFTAKDFGQ